MTKFVNPGHISTSRRNVLRGSVLVGAVAITGSIAGAAPTRQPSAMPRNILPDAQVLKIQLRQIEAAEPVDLSGLALLW